MEFPYGHPRHNRDRRDVNHAPPIYPPPPHFPGQYDHPPPHFPGQYDHPPPQFPGEYDHPPPPPQFPGQYDPPPPQVYHSNEPYPPPPQVYHTSHTGDPYTYPQSPPRAAENYPPPPRASENYPPPPRADSPPSSHHHHPHMPHFPSIIHHKDEDFANKPSVRVYSKAETNYSLAIRNGKVILARHDPNDPLQHWIKDEKYSTKIKDEQGFPSFALINKATGQAMKHSTGATQPVQLVPYNPNVVDESILWTESKDLGDSYRTIRMINNIRLNVDALNGDKNHGGVHDGTTIVLWEWKKGDNQRWKITRY